jgi:hypothetical protein
MFCPVCRAEYRRGFTRCADCDADLVASLSEVRGTTAPGSESNDESAVVLWAGVDPRMSDLISKALTDSGIEHTDESPPSVLLPAAATSILEIRVRTRDLEAAKKAVADRWDRPTADDADDDENSELPSDVIARNNQRLNPFHLGSPVFRRAPDQNAQDDEPESKSGDEHLPNDYVENFDPEEATVLIWSGDDSQMAQIFDDCLSNVGIGSVLRQSSGRTDVYVMPAAEKRAREVVREIEEGTPME